MDKKIFYVLATDGGEGYPSVFAIFSSEELATKAAEERHTDCVSSELSKKQAQFMPNGYPSWLGKAEEGEDITYYRQFTDKGSLADSS